MLHIKANLKAKCPKHPRYSPERGGREAVRGECPFCLLLCEIDLHASRLHTSGKQFRELLEMYDRQKAAGRKK